MLKDWGPVMVGPTFILQANRSQVHDRGTSIIQKKIKTVIKYIML